MSSRYYTENSLHRSRRQLLSACTEQLKIHSTCYFMRTHRHVSAASSRPLHSVTLGRRLFCHGAFCFFPCLTISTGYLDLQRGPPRLINSLKEGGFC